MEIGKVDAFFYTQPKVILFSNELVYNAINPPYQWLMLIAVIIEW